jgi:hypothetical protein
MGMILSLHFWRTKRMTTLKDNSYDFGSWIFRQDFDHHRRMVVIQMPDRMQYVSRTTIKGLIEGWWRRRIGQTFVCNIRQGNKIKVVAENNMRQFEVVGTELHTDFRGYDRKNGSDFSGDVYEVDAIKREGDTVIVTLGKQLVKLRRLTNSR